MDSGSFQLGTTSAEVGFHLTAVQGCR